MESRLKLGAAEGEPGSLTAFLHDCVAASVSQVMKWLITVSGSVDGTTLGAILSRHGVTVGSAQPVPLEGNEYVVEAEGPPDLPARLGQEKGIRGVYPSSEQTLY